MPPRWKQLKAKDAPSEEIPIMEINEKDVQDMDMDESDSQMDYEDEINQTTKSIVTSCDVQT